MKANVGKADKVVRVIIGITAGVLGIVFKSWWGLLGIIPLSTAFISWCPIYAPFGISTIAKPKIPKS